MYSQLLSFPVLTVEDVKLKIKTIRTRYAAELAKLINSENSGAGLHDMYVPKLFCFKQAHSFLLAFVFHKPVSTDANFINNFSTFVD
ncbi:hypothetical protein Cfor_06767 [Coptotermes formosanus]|uniref:Uncharacterized protein n=1 Tax=Coptotermes formosanus TaxID=36987 RepID=A0A6L2PFC5_COPFO|nr:hypothetical protein Cfor_06767 [Coptotermes formosanus]